jgi:HEPN domain-containing protein
VASVKSSYFPMKRKKLDKITQYWIEHSNYDFVTARAMLKARRYLYVSFMCQQSVEKLLKAVIVLKIKIAPPGTHDLSKLAIIAKISLNNEQSEFLAELTPFCIIARYAGYKKKLSELMNVKLAKAYFKRTEELLKWLKETEIYVR